jgi:hypothetical protein
MTAVFDPSIPRITTPKPTHGGAPSHAPPDTQYVPGNSLARFLGYFSIGLGLAEVAMPRTMARATGVKQEGLLELYGLREIGCGIAILGTNRPTEWLWARVAGDVLDLVTIAANLADADEDDRERLLASTAAVAGVAILDVICASQLTAAAALTDD